MRQRGVRGNTDSILAQNDPFVTVTSTLCLQLALSPLRAAATALLPTVAHHARAQLLHVQDGEDPQPREDAPLHVCGQEAPEA